MFIVFTIGDTFEEGNKYVYNKKNYIILNL